MTTVKEAINNLRQDFELLRDGSWNPDDDSINASLSMLDIIENSIDKPVETTNEQPNYKKAYEILSAYFDSISDEEQPKVAKKLAKLGL